MKIRKIETVFEDDRGRISDIFYKKDINHVALIYSKKGAIRGNHFHKKTTQHILILKGSLRYYCKASDDENSKLLTKDVGKGFLITTPPYEEHAMEILEDNEFMVFSEGLRGGKDYEKDTFKLKQPLVKKRVA